MRLVGAAHAEPLGVRGGQDGREDVLLTIPSVAQYCLLLGLLTSLLRSFQRAELRSLLGVFLASILYRREEARPSHPHYRDGSAAGASPLSIAWFVKENPRTRS